VASSESGTGAETSASSSPIISKINKLELNIEFTEKNKTKKDGPKTTNYLKDD
jgi:hypothetical protein